MSVEAEPDRIPTDRVAALIDDGNAADRVGAVLDDIDPALASAEGVDDDCEVARRLAAGAHAALRRGDVPGARGFADRAARGGFRHRTAPCDAIRAQGVAATAAGDLEAALPQSIKAPALARELGRADRSAGAVVTRGAPSPGAAAGAASSRCFVAHGLAPWLAALILCGCGSRREADPARTEPLAVGSDGGDRLLDGGTAAPGDDPDGLTGVAGGIPVWQAVIDRDRYLARRGQGAVIVGRLGGEAIAPGARGAIRWVIDETEGNGALAVRVALTGAVPDAGTRLAVRGAWVLDNQLRWYWQAERVIPLSTPAPAAPPDPPAPPGHQLGGAAPPPGYRAVSRARDGGVIVFGVIRPPPSDGDGWLVGDNSFGAPIARLTLPGERASYGGHDLRHDDERWQLKRGVLYWVRIDRVRRGKAADSPAVIRAVTAPMKVQ